MRASGGWEPLVDRYSLTPFMILLVEPGVDLLLDVDREYRRKAESGALPKIMPRRFNPSGEAWLPILHTERGDWHFTAAHETGS